MLEEKLIPDEICLCGLGQFPEIVVRDAEIPEALGDEVMVDEQIVNSPKQQLAESGIVKMSMDVIDRSLGDDLFDFAGEVTGSFLHDNGCKRLECRLSEPG